MRTKTLTVGILMPALVCSWIATAVAEQQKRPNDDPLDDMPGVFSIGTIVEGLGKAAEKFAAMKQNFAEASLEIAAARKAFWDQYPNGPRRAQAEAEFARQLYAKDLYLLTMARVDGRCRGGALPKQMEAWGHLVKMADGEIDGGLADGTASLFCRWVNAARGREPNAATTLPEYKSYKLGRDWEEFSRAGKVAFDSWGDFYRSKEPRWYVLGLIWGHNEYGIKRDKYAEGSFPEIFQRTRDTFETLAKSHGREKVLGIAKKLMDAPKRPPDPRIVNDGMMDTGFLHLANPQAAGCARSYVDGCFFELLLPRTEPVAAVEAVTHSGRGVARGSTAAAPAATPAPAAATMPATPLQPCGEPLRSGDPTLRTVIEFVNISSQPRRLFWIDFTGNRHLKGVVMPGLPVRWPTFVTHAWQITDMEDTCLGTVVISKEMKRVEIR